MRGLRAGGAERMPSRSRSTGVVVNTQAVDGSGVFIFGGTTVIYGTDGKNPQIANCWLTDSSKHRCDGNGDGSATGLCDIASRRNVFRRGRERVLYHRNLPGNEFGGRRGNGVLVPDRLM